MSMNAQLKSTTATAMQHAKTPMAVLLVIVMSATKERGQPAAVSRRLCPSFVDFRKCTSTPLVVLVMSLNCWSCVSAWGRCFPTSFLTVHFAGTMEQWVYLHLFCFICGHNYRSQLPIVSGTIHIFDDITVPLHVQDFFSVPVARVLRFWSWQKTQWCCYQTKEPQSAIMFGSAMGLVRITSWYSNFNGSHFGLLPSEIHRMTGLPPKIVWTMTYLHRPHCLAWYPFADQRNLSETVWIDESIDRELSQRPKTIEKSKSEQDHDQMASQTFIVTWHNKSGCIGVG